MAANKGNDNKKSNATQSTQQQQSDKFELHPGDLKFFSSKEEIDRYFKDKYPDRKLVWRN